MGTTYRVVYFDEPARRNFKPAVDSLLQQVNAAINTYDPDSEISRFNRSERGVCLKLPYLHDILRKARHVYRVSDGAFDPTVMPLVDAWGFGPHKSAPPSHQQVDSLRGLVGFHRIQLRRNAVRKSDSRIQLDMGGIGQGYGADVIYRFLKSQGIEHLLVELGGEGIASGRNLQKDRPWQIGILDPNSTPDNQFFKAYVSLVDRAFTTSGNYFNYKIVDGRKLGHTIDPVSGNPVQHSLLSASVFAPDCTTADAWATAFMVMGMERAKEKLKKLTGVDVLFIYSDSRGELQTYISPGISKDVILQ